MDDVKSIDSFSTDVEDGNAFLLFWGCFVSFLIVSDGLCLLSVFFKSLPSS